MEQENKYTLGIKKLSDGTYELIIPPSEGRRGIYSIINQTAYDYMNEVIKKMCTDVETSNNEEKSGTSQERESDKEESSDTGEEG